MRRFLWAALLLLLPALLRAQDSVIVIDPDAPPTDTLLRGGPPPGVALDSIDEYGPIEWVLLNFEAESRSVTADTLIRQILQSVPEGG